MKQNQFNLVAPVYDVLVSLAFGKTLDKVQTHYLDVAANATKVLIIGGGTGKILRHPALQKAARVDYVELSEKMIAKAKSRVREHSNVKFILRDFFDHEGRYDLIVCHFFLDCFDDEHLRLAVSKLHHLIDPKGFVLVSDFRAKNAFLANWLTQLMILFFRLFARLQANKLLDIEGALTTRFHLVKQTRFKNDWLFSAIYRPIEQ